jgi:hypothetical protein
MFTGGGGDYCPLDGDFGCSEHYGFSWWTILIFLPFFGIPTIAVIVFCVKYNYLKFVKRDHKAISTMKLRIQQDLLYRTFSYRKKTSTQTYEKADPDKSDETQTP